MATHNRCDYCRRAVVAAATECAHCGASLLGAAGSLPAEWFPAAAPARAVGPAIAAMARHWALAAIGVTVVAMLGLAVASHFPHPPAAAGDPAGRLPVLLREAASCVRYDTARQSDRCVIPAFSPTLAAIGDGRGVTFYAEMTSPQRLSPLIRQWRVAGGEIVVDAAVFAAVDPALDVRFADTRTGLQIETDTFPDRRSAEAFLTHLILAT